MTDGLEFFEVFKENGHEYNVCITGSGSESVKNPEFRWVHTIIGNVKNALQVTWLPIDLKLTRDTAHCKLLF